MGKGQRTYKPHPEIDGIWSGLDECIGLTAGKLLLHGGYSRVSDSSAVNASPTLVQNGNHTRVAAGSEGLFPNHH